MAENNIKLSTQTEPMAHTQLQELIPAISSSPTFFDIGRLEAAVEGQMNAEKERIAELNVEAMAERGLELDIEVAT